MLLITEEVSPRKGTYLIDALCDIVGRRFNFLIDGLTRQQGDFFGLCCEWIRIPGLDNIHGLICETVGVNDQRS